jgi:hypothetical protein
MQMEPMYIGLSNITRQHTHCRICCLCEDTREQRKREEQPERKQITGQPSSNQLLVHSINIRSLRNLVSSKENRGVHKSISEMLAKIELGPKVQIILLTFLSFLTGHIEMKSKQE